MLLALPLFVWAVLTQRIELRKRAATSEPTQICWNRVTSVNNALQWPNSCKGNPRTDLVCTQILIPLTSDEVTQYNQWIALGKPYITGCETSVTSTPAPTITAPPTPTVTPTPTPFCASNTPTLTITPQSQTGSAGGAKPYTITVTNTDGPACQSSEFALTVQAGAAGWGWSFSPSILTLSPGKTATTNLTVTSPSNISNGTVVPVSVSVKNARSSLAASATASYTVLSNPQTVTFNVKLGGVTGDSAQGAKIAVKFLTREGAILQFNQPLSLTYTGNGIYQATAVLTNPFPSGTAFTVSVKGEKHLAVRFCQQTGQDAPCAGGTYITVPDPIPLTYGFDFTGRPLPPGDIYPQDGQVDQTDINRMVNLLSKPASGLTAQDLVTGDLNYDGVINGYDLFLLMQTARTQRYDE